MARRPKKEVEARSRAKAFVGDRAKRKKRKRRTGPTPSRVKKLRSAVADMLATKDFSSCEVPHVVALFAELHEWCYAVDAPLIGKDFLGAQSAASKMLREEFDGEMFRLLDYVRWGWKREAERERWRVENGKSGGVLTWRQMFASRTMLTHYKIDLRRKSGEA